MVVEVAADNDGCIGVLPQDVADKFSHPECSVLFVKAVSAVQITVEDLYLHRA